MLELQDRRFIIMKQVIIDWNLHKLLKDKSRGGLYCRLSQFCVKWPNCDGLTND